MLVGRIVVHDQVQVQFRWSFGVDLPQELQPFLMSMSRVAATDHPAIEHTERRKPGAQQTAQPDFIAPQLADPDSDAALRYRVV